MKVATMNHTLVPPRSARAETFTELRGEVREFLAQQIANGVFQPQVDSWGQGWNPTFTRALAERGWVGMTIPEQYGGRGRTFLERFAVTEELLAAGAPVSAHWVSDRQAAPSLLKFGTEQQRQRFLPKIANGELFWAIGMSEPGSGSDLASVRTKGEQVSGGWRVSGTKLWTSGAHQAHYMFALARTSPLDTANRHAGLSQFIIPLDAPGVEISPIIDMSGDHHFNEVVLTDVFVPDDLVLGEVGQGWTQVTSELGYERSGPERVLSSFPLLSHAVDQTSNDNLSADPRLGAMVARLYGLRQMSNAVAEALENQVPAELPAAVVKLLGTTFEGDVIEVVDELVDRNTATERTRQLLLEGTLRRPGFTVRGGTTEILRGVVARGMGLR